MDKNGIFFYNSMEKLQILENFGDFLKTDFTDYMSTKQAKNCDFDPN